MESRYEILDKIGEGGRSEVFKAFDRHLNRFVAIKKVNGKEEHLLLEAEILMKLKHPAIPVIYDIVKEEERNCIIMEYMEGVNLLSFLEKEGFVEEKTAVKIGIRISECLQYLHHLPEKIIYRDLKPANILLDETGQIKLIDFDSAFTGKERKDRKVRSGTYGYSAPEQFEAGLDIDEKSDIYGLGTTLYHLLTGKNPSKPPYHFYKIRDVNPLITEELEEVVENCMSEERQKRYGDMGEVLQELKRCGNITKEGRSRKKRGKRRYMIEEKKNILLTEKQGGGLFFTLLLLCMLTFFTGFVYGSDHRLEVVYGKGENPEAVYAKEKDEILPLITYNVKREKILIKNGSFYETDQDFHMAIPKECLKEAGVKVTVICKELGSGKERERVLLLKEKNP